MMLHIKSIILSILLCSSILVFSQKASVVRMEVPSALESGTFQVETLGTDGIMIFYESNEISSEYQRKWYFGLFDTKLNQVWLKFIPLNDGIQFLISTRRDHMLHLLFRSLESGKPDNDSYAIVSYNIKTQAFSNISGTIPQNAEIVGFEVIDDKACIGLNLKKNNTDILFVNLNNGEIEVETIESDNESYLETIAVDPLNKHFYIQVKYVKDKRYLEDKIIRYSRSGKKETSYSISNQEGLKLLRNFIFMPVKDNKLTILGTFDMITGKMVSLKDLKDDTEAKSVGMFFLQYEDDVQKTLKYYDFLNFDNIYGSMEGREMSYSKNKGQNEEDEKLEKSLSAFFHFQSPSVIKKNDQYIFTVEIYKPYYRSETQMDYDFYGRPMPRSYNIFDGYQFYDLIIASLSEKGDLIWNNDFEIKNMRTFFLEKHVAIFQDEDFLSMAYVNDGKLFSQTIDGPVDLNKEEIAIETQFSKDRVTEDENNSIVHWFDHFFLIYGYQKLKNRSLGDQSIRTVFYANKVAFN